MQAMHGGSFPSDLPCMAYIILSGVGISVHQCPETVHRFLLMLHSAAKRNVALRMTCTCFPEGWTSRCGKPELHSKNGDRRKQRTEVNKQNKKIQEYKKKRTLRDRGGQKRPRQMREKEVLNRDGEIM